jgi:hypothetical protein
MKTTKEAPVTAEQMAFIGKIIERMEAARSASSDVIVRDGDHAAADRARNEALNEESHQARRLCDATRQIVKALTRTSDSLSDEQAQLLTRLAESVATLDEGQRQLAADGGALKRQQLGSMVASTGLGMQRAAGIQIQGLLRALFASTAEAVAA